MRTLWLDYQARRPGQAWPGWCVLAVALAGASVLMAHFVTLQREVTMLETRVSKSQRVLERRRLRNTTQDTANALGQTLAKRLAASGPDRWEAIFKAFEASADERVTLVSLSPGGEEIVLTGEAKDLPATSRYVERLQAQVPFVTAHLVDYEFDKNQPQHPIHFTVSVPLSADTH